MAFWSDGDGTLFLLTEEKGAVLLTLLDAATLTPVATQELFPAAEGAPHHRSFHSLRLFLPPVRGRLLAVLNRRSGAWVVTYGGHLPPVLPGLSLEHPFLQAQPVL